MNFELSIGFWKIIRKNFSLQNKVLRLILLQAGLTEGDALEGVVAELTTLVIHGHDTAARAQHHAAVSGTTSVLAIFTAGLYVVAVQLATHGESLPFE